MKLYRITPAAFADLSGEGARKFPGRWNTEGIPCVYTSSSASLALLEILVNAEDWTLFERVAHVLLTLHVDAHKLKTIRTQDLPKNWNSSAITETTRQFGSHYLKDPAIAGIILPSVILPSESNIILNPHAVHFPEHVKLISSDKFTIDHRLLK